MIFLRKYRNL